MNWGRTWGSRPGGALHADAQTQPSPILLSDLLDLIFQNLIGAEHSLGGPEIALPSVSGTERLHRAVKQLYPQLPLDLPQHLTQRGLADIQLFCRRRHAPLLGDSADVAGLFQIHMVPSFPRNEPV